MDHEAFFKGLNDAGVDCLVTGALALNLHGLPRMSCDIDLVLAPDEGNILAAVRHFLALGYRPRQALKPEEMADPEVRRRWAAGGERALRLLLAEGDLAEVDLALEPHAPYGELKGRAVTVRIIDAEVPVMSLGDMKTLKALMDRPKDREDLAGLSLLEEMAAGGAEKAAQDPRREQIAKFGHWSMEARCQWLLTSSQLAQQHSPETARGRGSFRGKKGIHRKKILGLNKPDLS
jgi:hypothetical protein